MKSGIRTFKHRHIFVCFKPARNFRPDVFADHSSSICMDIIFPVITTQTLICVTFISHSKGRAMKGPILRVLLPLKF